MRYLLAALAALMLAPSLAFAQAPPTDDPQTTTRAVESLRIAADFWDVSIPVRVFAVSGEELDGAGGTLGTIGMASANSVWLLDFLLTENTVESRIATCTAIVHEYGHLLGVGHRRGRRSVMRTELMPNEVVFGCYQRFMRAGHARRWRVLEGGRPVWVTR